MPMYRVIINKQLRDYVAGSSPVDAYFDVASSYPLKYDDIVEFEEVKTENGMADGINTINPSTVSTLDQELHLKPDSTAE